MMIGHLTHYCKLQSWVQ